MRCNSSVLFYLKFYILATKEAYQITNLVKFHGRSQKSEILHFDGLLLSKWYKVSSKKVQKSYLISQWRVMQSLCKIWQEICKICKVYAKYAKYDRNLVNFHLTTQKSENFTSMGSFCSKYLRFELKEYRRVIFHDTEHWCKIRIPWPCGFKNGMNNWVNFHCSTQKSENCTLLGFFCPKHIMLQLGIMCHDTEG